MFTDDAKVYQNLEHHDSVKHSMGEYVRNHVHTNGIESFWALFKRGYHGTYHKISKKHLARYVTEFIKRSNIRREDTLEQMCLLVRGMAGRRLTYENLIATFIAT